MNQLSTRRSVAAGIVLAVLMLSAVTNAQQYLATISGTVKDSTGAVVPGAQVKVTGLDTGFVTVVATNDDGNYAAPFLTPGNYSVSVTAQGFKPQQRTGIVLNASNKLQIDVTLAIGSVSERVEVTTNSLLIETGTANIGQVIDSKQATDLPNIGRNPFILGTLAAGAFSDFAQRKVSQFTQPYSGVASQMAINGLGNLHRLELNGVPDDPPERLSAVTYTGFVPSPEAVQEVTVQTALYDAQYGHSDGAVINSVLKTGSNQFHASAYYILQNTILDANTFERNAQNPSLPISLNQWNQPGFVVTGPVLIPKIYNGHNKTFFSFAYEHIKNNLPQPMTFTVPTDAERNGDFSGLRQANGQPVLIYDPLTTNSSGIRTAFPGNVLTRMDPVAQKLLAFIPHANVPGNGAGGRFNNYIPVQDTIFDHYYSWLTRIDHQISENEKLSGSVYRSVRQQVTPSYGFLPGTAPAGCNCGYTHFRNDLGGTLDLVSVLSPTLVLDSRAGVVNHPFSLRYSGDPWDVASLGFPQSLIAQLPAQTFPGLGFSDGYAGAAAGSTSQFSYATEYSLSEVLSKSFRTHTMKAGFEFEGLRYNLFSNPVSGFGSFNFNRGFTQRNAAQNAGADPASGDGFASFLLGVPSSGSVTNNIAPAYQRLYYGVFVQDDWRVLSRLTLNLGLRWDYEKPLTERFDRMNAGFCFTCTNPVNIPNFSVPGGLLFVNSHDDQGFHSDHRDWGPRIGASYQAMQKLVLRGGFGVIYLPTIDPPGTLGYRVDTSYVASTNSNFTPANSLSNPFPAGILAPVGNSLGLATQLGQSISFSDPSRVIPRMYEYSFGIEYQLPAETVVNIGYVGNSVTRLQVSKRINDLPSQFFSMGNAALTKQVPNPMAGFLPGSGLNNPTIPAWQLLVPYPEFGSITENARSLGSFSYNSLQTSVRKRLSRGLSGVASFTFAKIMDKNIYLNPQDNWSNLFRYEDPQPNRLFRVGFTYSPPIPKLKNAVLDSLVGGWQVNGVLRWQNGVLINNPGGAIPLLKSPKTANPSNSHFFDTCYIDTNGVIRDPNGPGAGSCAPGDVPAFQQLNGSPTGPPFALNVIGPFMNGIRSQVTPLFDASLFKKFLIRERFNLELRGEFFNLTNTVNFGNPNTSLTSSQFGFITRTQANDPRIGQVTIRLNF